jgi:hypothetical protein
LKNVCRIYQQNLYLSQLVLYHTCHSGRDPARRRLHLQHAAGRGRRPRTTLRHLQRARQAGAEAEALAEA